MTCKRDNGRFCRINWQATNRILNCRLLTGVKAEKSLSFKKKKNEEYEFECRKKNLIEIKTTKSSTNDTVSTKQVELINCWIWKRRSPSSFNSYLCIISVLYVSHVDNAIACDLIFVRHYMWLLSCVCFVDFFCVFSFRALKKFFFFWLVFVVVVVSSNTFSFSSRVDVLTKLKCNWESKLVFIEPKPMTQWWNLH